MKNIYLPILLLSSSFPILTTNAEEHQDSIMIQFKQGKSEIISNFAGNKEALSKLDSISLTGKTAFKEIRINGAASPEGGVSLNYNLSDHRAESLLGLLYEKLPGPAISPEVSFSGRDWERLLTLVENDDNVPYKTETVQLLTEITDQIRNSGMEKEEMQNLSLLKKLCGGKPYAYLYKNLFPSLRAARVYFDYFSIPTLPSDDSETVPGIEIPVNPTPVLISYAPIALQGNEKNFYMALKTNMLYDLAALPSISAEFYLGKNFSAVANWTYGWWDKDRTHRYWRAYGGDLALRWWFGNKSKVKPLTGQHIGIYGGIFTYDFEFGGTGYMGGLPGETLWNRSLRMVGIEYGYSLPIARRLNIDFTIGIGYLGGKYIKYIPDDGRYLWQSTHKLNWFGPTKAEISLVWLIGRGNYNQ